jgi:hypothetical protein
MAVTASAKTNTFSMPGVLLTNNYPDILNEQFDRIKIRKWGIDQQGLPASQLCDRVEPVVAQRR